MTFLFRGRWLLAALLLMSHASAPAQSPAPIEYDVRFDDRQHHYADITATFPAGGAGALEVAMAVWTPGSYLVREYAGKVEEIRATDAGGKDLPLRQSRKNRWEIETRGADLIRLSYRVYCREMSVRTNWVERDFAVLNGAPTFMTLAGDLEHGVDRPHRIRLHLPDDWADSQTGLPRTGREAHDYTAPNFDLVVDSPIVLGNPDVAEFSVRQKKHYLVNAGDPAEWDTEKAAADVKKIVEEYAAMWRGLPYDDYRFLNVISEAGGGLEHLNSTLMMARRFTMNKRKSYLSWLGLVSHEYVHVWNVKRLRPEALGPFNYEAENHTRDLWIAEGFTSYYTPVAVRRAAISTQKEFLGAISSSIKTLQTTPGRLVLPVGDASFEAWTKAYRSNENTPNTAISYYTKGAVIAFVLDAKIRRRTMGEKSLDDVMRLAYQRFSGERGYTSAEFREAASEVAGMDLTEFFRRAVDETEELDYAEALEWYGLRFKPPAEESDDDAEHAAWLGLRTTDDHGRLVVRQVRRGTPAYEAGLNVGDEIIAINDYRVAADDIDDRLEVYRPDDELSLLIARRERLMRLDVTAAKEPFDAWRLEPDPDANKKQKQRLKAWQASSQ